MLTPDFSNEQALIERGFRRVCGVDEAGRGPLAGPVVAAAVVLDPQAIPDGLNDSKKLSAGQRSRVFDDIILSAQVGIASLAAPAIDTMNIRAASLCAMNRAVRALPVAADHALIDGNVVPPDLPCSATALVKGDGRSLSIAAASIVAKVMRDRMMVCSDEQFPGYGFAQHKGYPTAAHREALAQLGASPLHRRSFSPVADLFS